MNIKKCFFGFLKKMMKKKKKEKENLKKIA